MSDEIDARIRKAYDAAERLTPAEETAAFEAIAAALESLGAGYMEAFAEASGFDVEALKTNKPGKVDEGARYWEKFGILGILRPLLVCNIPPCADLPLLSIHGKLMHMQHHEWTGKDAAAYLRGIKTPREIWDK